MLGKLKNGSTNFLRLAILALGSVILLICFYLFPAFLEEDEARYRLLIIGLYIAAVPFFAALYQALTLLNLIDKGRAFSRSSVTALTRIKACALIIAGLFVLYTPLLYPIAEEEDAPGVLLFGMIIGFASLVVAVFAALMQRVLEDALKIKSENDLTV